MRPFVVYNVPQRTEEWFLLRAGRLTGSRAGAMLAKIAKGEAAGRRNLRVALVLERLTGKTQEPEFISDAMQQGIDREADALSAYEDLTGEMVWKSGFLAHLDLLAGCSLDGHLDDYRKLLSIKCRQPAAHLEFLKSGTIPADALAQIRHELWITGAVSHDYFSWNPDFPKALRSRIVTVTREEADIDGYDVLARAFLAEVDAEALALATMNDLSGQLQAAV